MALLSLQQDKELPVACLMPCLPRCLVVVVISKVVSVKVVSDVC
jgi:hypothetical protein